MKVILIRVIIEKRGMIFVHLFIDNFEDSHVFLSFYWSKTIDREKGIEKIKTSC